MVKAAVAAEPLPTQADLKNRFANSVHPFLQTYCITCHSGAKPKGDFDLSPFASMDAVAKDNSRWTSVLEKLKAQEMPPPEAKVQPTEPARQEIVEWITDFRNFQSNRNAGDPGVVMARRLSNSEYDYTIRDLTGVDIRPTREFPIDPANTAGFDNSGESLDMSPALLDKYLKAARNVADHLYLKPDGFAFAPYPMLVETDRDKFCVQQIIDFYHQFDTDYADYFQAAWRYKHRAELGKPDAKLADFAADGKISAKYLATIWSTLEGEKAAIGPLAKLQKLWLELPAPVNGSADISRKGCEAMRDYVVQVRKKVEVRFLNIVAGKLGSASQPFLIWKDRQYATHRMTFDPAQLQVAGEPDLVPDKTSEPGADNEFGPGHTLLVKNDPGDPDLAVPSGQRAQYEAAFAEFCSVFPDMFYKQERGRNYFDTSKDKGRYLSAGFHNVMGYFRDDVPFYKLLLDGQQEQQLDEMWHELDFVASANIRTYLQFSAGALGRSVGAIDPSANDAPPPPPTNPAEDHDATSETKIKALEANFVAQAQGGSEVAIQAVKDYFDWVNDGIRWVEKARIDAEPTHLQSLFDFAARAYRRPLTKEEHDDFLAFYHSCRDKDGMDHESAMRELIVAVLMSPDFSYRIDLVDGEKGIHALSDYALASRLSYFLWSSKPDEQLLSHAAAGDLHDLKVLKDQTHRMLQDARVRGLATEFGGNWLDFRRFEDLNTVDRDRFPMFTSDLREAMFEEPIRFFTNLAQTNGSIVDFLAGDYTFVNPVLAQHYGIPLPNSTSSSEWIRIDHAGQYDRGGLLPMAVFQTKNAPGLRTSPVKRGYWVVKRLLGEEIPPPPPNVPVLPTDESKLGDLTLPQMLAQHRQDKTCAACHEHFDAIGLAFEGFGPVGEKRSLDLGGKPVQNHVTFRDGSEGTGLDGVRAYLLNRRKSDFTNNFCSKLVAYALSRSLIPSDDVLIRDLGDKLEANGGGLQSIIESIVTSPQFLNKRGPDDLAER
jgi:hypothetical protein